MTNTPPPPGFNAEPWIAPIATLVGALLTALIASRSKDSDSDADKIVEDYRRLVQALEGNISDQIAVIDEFRRQVEMYRKSYQNADAWTQELLVEVGKLRRLLLDSTPISTSDPTPTLTPAPVLVQVPGCNGGPS